MRFRFVSRGPDRRGVPGGGHVSTSDTRHFSLGGSGGVGPFRSLGSCFEGVHFPEPPLVLSFRPGRRKCGGGCPTSTEVSFALLPYFVVASLRLRVSVRPQPWSPFDSPLPLFDARLRTRSTDYRYDSDPDTLKYLKRQKHRPYLSTDGGCLLQKHVFFLYVWVFNTYRPPL